MKRISKETASFSLHLIQFEIENYPAILKGVERASKNAVRLIALISFPQESLIEPFLKAIDYFKHEYRNGDEILIVPARRWSVKMTEDAPEVMAKIIADILRDATGREKEEVRYIE